MTKELTMNNPVLNINNSFHITIQKKGGAGKSYIARLIAEFLKKQNPNAKIFDSDDSNHSLEKYMGLSVNSMNDLFIHQEDHFGKSKKFNTDFWCGEFFQDVADAYYPILTDGGASNYDVIVEALTKTHWIKGLHSLNPEKKIFFHIPISGLNGMQADCFIGIVEIINIFKDNPNVFFILWENLASDENNTIKINGTPYKELEKFKEIEQYISGIIHVPLNGMAAETWDKSLKWGLTLNELTHGFSVNDIYDLMYKFESGKDNATDLDWEEIEKVMTKPVIEQLTNLATNPYWATTQYSTKEISQVMRDVLPLFKITNRTKPPMVNFLELQAVSSIIDNYHNELAKILNNC